MLIEIEKAVNFLSNMIRCKNPSIDQLTTFRESLTRHFATRFVGHWFPERPMKGNAYRCVRIVNNKMDAVLAAAGVDAGWTNKFLLEVFPAELSVWIDPEEVSYRIGEDGSVGVVGVDTEDMDTDSCSSLSSEDDIIESQRLSPDLMTMSSVMTTTTTTMFNRVPIINPTTNCEIVVNSSTHLRRSPPTVGLRCSPETVNAAYIQMIS